MIEALKRLKHLQIREKELEGKLKTSAETLEKSKEEKATLCLQLEKKEEEIKERMRENERNFILKLDDQKVRLRKMELEQNGRSKFARFYEE